MRCLRYVSLAARYLATEAGGREGLEAEEEEEEGPADRLGSPFSPSSASAAAAAAAPSGLRYRSGSSYDSSEARADRSWASCCPFAMVVRSAGSCIV